MGIINRFLLFVLMIGLALLAVLMLLLCMGAVPEPVWLNELHYILSRRETLIWFFWQEMLQNRSRQSWNILDRLKSA